MWLVIMGILFFLVGIYMAKISLEKEQCIIIGLYFSAMALASFIFMFVMTMKIL